jgi:hypothetical protein
MKGHSVGWFGAVAGFEAVAIVGFVTPNAVTPPIWRSPSMVHAESRLKTGAK